MPEKTQSVQVDAAARTKVQRAAEVLGSTQQIAASLLIEVADMTVVLKRHQEAILKRHQEGMARRPKTETGQPSGPGGHRATGPSMSDPARR